MRPTSKLLSILLFFCIAKVSQSEPSLQCTTDITAYQLGLTSSLKPWALKMLDSSTKLPPDGLLQGTFLYQLGNFDECLSVNGPLNNDGDPRFKGKFCRVQLGFKANGKTEPKVKLMLNMMKLAYDKISSGANLSDSRGYLTSVDSHASLFPETGPTIPAQWAVCAPSSCNADGVKRVADFNLGLFFSPLNLDVSTRVIEDSCYSIDDGSKDLDTGSWLFLIFFICLTTVMAYSTVCDYVWPEHKALNVIVKAFSLRTNLRELFTLPKSAAPGQLTCLHGIRVISTWWVILLHCYMINISIPPINALLALEAYRYDWTMAPIYSGGLSVDTFFLLSGLLTGYVVLLDQKKGRSFNIFKYYVFRYIRITAPLAAVVFYLATLHAKMGSGPVWDVFTTMQAQNCEKNWWATLLYIVNYYKPIETFCVSQAWYLMVDMQLALLAPIVVFPLLKWPKFGLGLIGLLMVGSMAMDFAYTMIYNLPWTITFLVPEETTGDFNYLIYTNTPARAVPYLFGMILAYILANKMTIKLPKWSVILDWILNTALCLAIIYVIIIPYSKGYDYDNISAAFYAAFHRLGWSVGVSWVIWACVNGYGGPVDSILSWKYFLPLSKLSFCAYLVHMDLMYYHMSIIRSLSYLSHFEMVFEFLGNLIMMIPLTFWLYLAVDAPCQVIIRAAFGKPNRAAISKEDDVKHLKTEKASEKMAPSVNEEKPEVSKSLENNEIVTEDNKKDELEEIKSTGAMLSTKVGEFLLLFYFLHFWLPICRADCESDIAAYIQGLQSQEREEWALTMLDSSAKIPAGLIVTSYQTPMGNVMTHLGNFDECVSLEVNQGELNFKGQYCKATMQLSSSENKFENISLPGQWAVCAPSTCGPEGVKEVADFNLNFFLSPFNVTTSTTVLGHTCYYDGNGFKNLDAAAWVFISFSTILIVWIICSTALEILSEKNSFFLVSAYSLKSNLRDLFKIPRKFQPGQLGCLNGIRVLSTLWIILCHTYGSGSAYPNINMQDAYNKYLSDPSLTVITNGALAVDTFFFLSGLLTAYIVCMERLKGRPFIVWKYYIYRYLRLTPPYAFMIFYLATIHRLFITGPYWDWIESAHQRCSKWWWLNLLYVTNYFKSNEAPCVGQAWYLNVDMQLSFLAPLILLPLFKWPKQTLWAMGVLILASMSATFAVTYTEHLTWTVTATLIPGAKDFGKLVYSNTPMRAVTYLCGMLLGHLLSKNRKVIIPLWAVLLGWLSSTAICLSIMMTVSITYQDGFVYDPLQAAFYAGFHRLGWSLGLGWVIWCCVNGYAGPVDKILSWKYFVPLSKLSYCAYLVHMDVINAHMVQTRVPKYISHYEMMYLFFGELVMSTPFTLILYLVVEAPSLNILRTILGKKKNETKKSLDKENKINEQ
ncbi:uncharacterized protein LOC132201727 [Neocloeon triangulifer]|uniref:uncharacterized protein LOC132201727 n=1 Tax=Neocloeon triangulifer TaxID=2078957 RepID=UPI00286ECD76|nr:uncharacterized protein LOC132201727 [Neocloeon triangulifer]